MVYLLLFSILFIPSVYSDNVTLPKVDQGKTTNVKDVITISKTKLSKISEGGSVLPDNSALNLKDNITINLLSLEDGFGKMKKKPVHGRKGVGSPDEENISDIKSNVTVDLNTLVNNSSPIPEKTETTMKRPMSNSTVEISTEKHKNSTKVNTTQASTVIQADKHEVPKKPLKVVYETVVNMGQVSSTSKLSDKVILDQLTSSKMDSTMGKNPGMITPIVITILVVPMFAVLGYMALRRGQEAWKNRHYKRMDFLLDGMYND